MYLCANHCGELSLLDYFVENIALAYILFYV